MDFKLIAAFVFAMGSSLAGFAQNHSGLDVGTAVGSTYLEKEDEWATMVHIHVRKALGEHVYLGVGYEHISGEEEHGILGVSAGVRMGSLFLSYMPGFYLYGGSGVSHHFELGYIVEYGGFHLGPSLSVKLGEESHYSLGLHVGYSF